MSKETVIFENRQKNNLASQISGVKTRSIRGIRITDRDIALFDALRSAGFLITPQIQKLLFGSSTGTIGPTKACQRRLRLLTEHGLIRRVEQPVKRSEPSKPYIYTLARKGAEILAAELGLSLNDIDYSPSSAEDNYPFLDHLLATTDVRIAIQQSCNRNNLELDEWIDEKELRSIHWKEYVFIKSPDGKRQRVALVPDAYFMIRSGSKTMQFYCEIDRGTHTIRSQWNRGWTRKILSYLEYFQSDAYQKRFGTKQVYLLTTTTTEKRLAAIKNATEDTGGSGRFLFATQADASDPMKVLTAKIWHIAGQVDRYALLG